MEGTKPPKDIVTESEINKKLIEMGFQKTKDGKWESSPKEEVIRINTADL